MSKLVVNTGGMFSGKTTKLMEQAERLVRGKKQVVVLKPIIDNRYSTDEIVSHSGVRIKAKNCKLNDIIHPEVLNADCVMIDEIQFFDMSIEPQINYLLGRGKEVYVSGLDMDYLGEPFKLTSILMSKADEVEKLHAVCGICGSDATFSKRKDESDKDNISLGSDDKYVALCRKCWNKQKVR